MPSLIIRYSEIGLKGKNRQFFEGRLERNIRKHLALYDCKIRPQFRQMEISVNGPIEPVIKILQKIPGVANIHPTTFADLSLDSIKQKSREAVAPLLEHQHSPNFPFRVRARRNNQHFPLTSPEIEREVGADLLQAFPHLKVNLDHPSLEVGIEIWDQHAVIYPQKIAGLAGLPVNHRERVISLISGGIDSPVASWMIMKRGCQVIYTYFHSFPFVGEQTKEKVFDLVKLLSQYQPTTRLYVVPFAEIQKAIKAHTPERYRTLLYRRQMNLIANRIAHQEKAYALVTGDSLSQVASQTLRNLVCTTENAELPILRPLIGMDKDQIISFSRSIGTFPISIQDAPDCCTVFQPRHPATNAHPHELHKAEHHLDLDTLIQNSLDGCEIYNYSCTENQAIV